MTDFLLDSGTNGYVTTPVTLMTTELNTLASGGAATSSVGGTSGAFTQSSFGSALFLSPYLTFGGAITPSSGGQINVWFLRSPDGGTSFESVVATASTTVMALARSPDAIISLDNAAFASGKFRWVNGVYVPAPWEPFKIVLQNLSGSAFPASGNILKAGSVSPKY